MSNSIALQIRFWCWLFPFKVLKIEVRRHSFFHIVMPSPAPVSEVLYLFVEVPSQLVSIKQASN